MSRRLEQRTAYPQGDGSVIYDEWHPAPEEQEYLPDVTFLRDAEVVQLVRKWNREAKARGDNTRIRSVDEEEEG